MTIAPEKIWANFNGSDTGFGIYPDGYEDGDTVYIRADLVPQWQPIETAPKDGTVFLAVHWNYYSDWHVVWWQPEFKNFISSCREMVMATGYTIDGKSRKLHSPVTHSITHWMPRPTPPEKESK